MPIWRRNAGTLPRPMPATFWPLTISWPRLGRSISAMSFSRLDLPAPEWPVTNTISPAAISSDRSLSASRPFG